MALDVSSEELAVSELLRIGNIPAGTTVTHPEGEIVVNDGFIEWSSVEAGSYFFRFECFPYKEVEFNAKELTDKIYEYQSEIRKKGYLKGRKRITTEQFESSRAYYRKEIKKAQEELKVLREAKREVHHND